ncbi:MAG: ferredoxin [Candidatus Natronoplasma sp.]
MKNVKIDQETCIGCGRCVSACPDVFKLSDKVKSIVKEEYRTKGKDEGKVPDEKNCVDQAEESCPVDAISVS